MWERINLGVFILVAVDATKACKSILPVDIHGTRAANSLSARAAEGQGGIDFVLNLDQGIEDLRM
jgi:hypothetical protein